MRTNELIRQARLGKRISERDLALLSDLSIDELCDVEARADEFTCCIPARCAFTVCDALGLSLEDLIGLSPKGEDGRVPEQSVYIRTLLSAAHISGAELDLRIGYEEGFIDSIARAETDLLEYPLELALGIADATGSPKETIIAVLKGDLLRRSANR